MVSRNSYVWAAVFLALAALAIPWFMWRDDATALGLPLWLWYHILWMILAAAAFHTFGRRAWGLWVEETPSRGGR